MAQTIRRLQADNPTTNDELQWGYRFGVEGKDCVGLSLEKSKYCSAFSSAFYVPRNVTPGILFLLGKPEDSNDAEANGIINEGAADLTSITKFDSVFEKIIIKNLGKISERWGVCPFSNYGVKSVVTYACQWMINYGYLRPQGNLWFQETCVKKEFPVGGTRPPPGLCLNSTEDFINSVKATFSKDPSCDPGQQGAMEKRISEYQQRSVTVTNRNDTSNNCISWQTNEKRLGFCGYPTQISGMFYNLFFFHI
jgi:hypothetical protein